MTYALITGSTSGIGAEYAHQLAARGYGIVVVSNRREENLQMATSLSSRYGVEALPIYADLTRAEAAREIYDYVHQMGIEVEILVCNAGMLLFSTLCHTEPQALERIVALHCTTPTLLCRLFAERMVQRGRGRILVMSSITAWTPYPTISHYAATKAYLRSFAQSLWYELRGTGVSLTTVFPSAVDTPFYNLKAEHRRWLLRLGLMLSAEEVARKALRAMFRGRRRSLPGAWTKVEAAVCACLPAWALLPVLKLPVVKKILERV
jgi:short-subunit dehydrogenase